MEGWLNRVWYERGAGGALLRPLEALFVGASALRRLAFRAGWPAAPDLGCPVVVVGNLTVGGTGKTPLVVWLVARLAAAGYAVAVITRGYGRAARGVEVVTAESAPESVGDEPLLIARRTGRPVIVGRDRVAAARRAVQLGANVIVADDGLQHLRLARAFEIVVIDGERGFGNGRLLPAGPLREAPGRLGSVDAVVVNGTGPGAASLGAWRDGNSGGRSLVRPGTHPGGDSPLWTRMQLEPGPLYPLEGSGGTRALASLRGTAVHAVAGIGHPERFFATLRAAGIEPIEHPFEDHHAYSPGELVFSGGQPIVMTEKDAVKCGGFGLQQAWYLPVSAEVDRAEALLGKLRAALGAGHREG